MLMYGTRVVTRVDAVHGAEPDRSLGVGHRFHADGRRRGRHGDQGRVGDRHARALRHQALAEDSGRLAGLALAHQAAVAEHHAPVADAAHGVRRVRHQEDGPALLLEPLDPVDALALEALVAHGQDLVDHQHVGVHVDGHGEAQPHVHARRVELHRAVDELLQARRSPRWRRRPCRLPSWTSPSSEPFR